MAAINPTDRARADEKIKQARDEYELKESEREKRRAEERKRLIEKHSEELAELQDSYEGKYDEMKSRQKEKLSEREQAYQDKINSVKNVYQQSLRRKYEENDAARKIQRETAESELAKEKNVLTSQKENEVGKLRKVIQDKDLQYVDQINEGREKLQQSIDDHKSKSEASHQKVLAATVEDRDRVKQNMERELQDQRLALESELKAEKRSKERSDIAWNGRYKDSLESSKEIMDDTLNTKNEVLKSTKKEMTRKFNNVIGQKLEEIDKNNEQFKDEVNSRFVSQVRGRDSTIETLKTKLNNQMASSARLRGLEQKNIVAQYEDRIDDLDRQRKDQVDVLSELAHKRTSDVAEKSDDLLRHQNKNFKSKLNVMVSRNREDREVREQQHKDLMEQTSRSADKRVRAISKQTNEELKKISKYFDNNLFERQEAFQGRIEEQREGHSSEMTKFTNTMSDRFSELEDKFAKKFENLQAEYSDKLNKADENHAKEMHSLEKMFSTRMAEREKGFKMSQEATELKYETKIAVQNQKSIENVEKLNKRHEEEIKSLAERLGNYSKKV